MSVGNRRSSNFFELEKKWGRFSIAQQANNAGAPLLKALS
jgi:hypothetical protein